LELNGVKYSGVLVANVPLSQGETRTSSPCHAEAPVNEEEHDEEEPPKAAEEDSESHRSPVKQENEEADQDMEASEVLVNGSAAAGAGAAVPLLKDAVVS